MKISPEKVEQLATDLVDVLAEADGAVFKSGDTDLKLAIIAIMTDELMVEERLDAEVHKMLQAYKYEITMGRMNYDDLYRKLRNRLIAERRIVL